MGQFSRFYVKTESLILSKTTRDFLIKNHTKYQTKFSWILCILYMFWPEKYTLGATHCIHFSRLIHFHNVFLSISKFKIKTKAFSRTFSLK